MAKPQKNEASRRLGNRIADLRQVAGLNKSQLALYSGKSQAYVSRLESGDIGKPSLEALQAIARALGCTVSDLLGRQADHAGEAEILVPAEKASRLARIAHYPVATLDIALRVLEGLDHAMHSVVVEPVPERQANPERQRQTEPEEGPERPGAPSPCLG